MYTVATQKQISSTCQCTHLFPPCTDIWGDLSSMKKHFMQLNHSLLHRHFKIRLHYIAASPALTRDNNSVSKQNSDILRLGQTMPRLVTFILSKCLFTSKKVNLSTPGNLVQRQGGWEAQHDLSAPPPPHFVKKSVSKMTLKSSHTRTWTWITHFWVHCIYYLVLHPLPEEVLVRSLNKTFFDAPTNKKTLAKFLQNVFSPVLPIT